MRKGTLAAGGLLLLVLAAASFRRETEPVPAPAARLSRKLSAPRLTVPAAQPVEIAGTIRSRVGADPAAWTPVVEDLSRRDAHTAGAVAILLEPNLDRHAVEAWAGVARSSPDPASRALALRTLSRSATPEAVEALAAAERDADAGVRQEARERMAPPASPSPRKPSRALFGRR